MYFPREILEIILKIKFWNFRKRLIENIPKPLITLQSFFIMDPYFTLTFYESVVDLTKYKIIQRNDEILGLSVIVVMKKYPDKTVGVSIIQRD